MKIPHLEIVKNSTKEIHNFLGISEAILSVWKLIHRCECLRMWSEYNFRLKKCLNFSKIADFKHWSSQFRRHHPHSQNIEKDVNSVLYLVLNFKISHKEIEVLVWNINFANFKCFWYKVLLLKIFPVFLKYIFSVQTELGPLS